jgi:hypothetical protein
MEIISWENGDHSITDMPQCTEPVLANMVQMINDSFCRPCGTEDADLLCPSCSVQLLDLAHRTVGTKLKEGLAPVVTEDKLHLDPEVQQWLLELQRVLPRSVQGSETGSIQLDVAQLGEQARVTRSLATPHKIVDHFRCHFGINDFSPSTTVDAPPAGRPVS